MYALNLDKETGRILSACIVLPNGYYETMVIVDTLPDGDVYDYRYESGAYVYDPLPETVTEREPTATEILNAMLGVTE